MKRVLAALVLATAVAASFVDATPAFAQRGGARDDHAEELVMGLATHGRSPRPE